MKKFKYQKVKSNYLYTREERADTKLTDDDIDEIRHLRHQGLAFREIANQFGVAPSTIQRWCLTDKERHEKRQREYRKYGRHKMTKEERDRYSKRKREIKGGDLSLIDYRKHRVKRLKQQKGYRERNKERIRMYQRKYRLRNKEKLVI